MWASRALLLCAAVSAAAPLFAAAPNRAAAAPVEIKRRVLALYKSTEGDSPSDNLTAALLEQPLDTLGLVTDYRDIDAGLPTEAEMGPYRGVVTFFRGPAMRNARGYVAWVARQAAAGRRVVVFNDFGASQERGTTAFLRFGEVNAAFRALGLEYAGYWDNDPSRLELVNADPKMMAFEEVLHPEEINDYVLVRSIDPANQTFLTVRRRDMAGSASALVVATPRGGFAHYPSLLYEYSQGDERKARWHLNPYAFLAKALDAETAPRFDAATLNGRRLWMAHIDGDGFTTPSGSGVSSAQVLFERVLNVYKAPVSASVVTDEIAKDSTAQALARRIFALPHVIPASHSMSHPMDWTAPDVNAAAEIDHSFDYINRRLAPAGKKARLFTWSGLANPTPAAFKALAPYGGYNVNGLNGPGGFSHANAIDALHPSRTHLAPLVRRVGEALQFNERGPNDYDLTGGWQADRRAGYEAALGSFLLTAENPETPIHLYFHWYSGQTAEASRALETVFHRSLAQPVAPVHVTEYIDLVRDVRRARLYRVGENEFSVENAGSARTVVFPKEARGVDTSASRGVVGFAHRRGDLYVFLNESRHHGIVLGAPPARALYVRSASGWIDGWKTEGEGVSFIFRGHGPSEIRLVEDTGRRWAAWVSATGSRARPLLADREKGELVLRFNAGGWEAVTLAPAGSMTPVLASAGSPLLFVFLTLYALWFFKTRREEKA